MNLGQVNIFRKFLSKFKEIISQKYRREVLSEVICDEVSKLINIKENNKIKFLDYGSGYNPVLIKSVINKLSNRYKESSFEAFCYDFYADDHLKLLNKNKNIIFKKIDDIEDAGKHDFCLIIDVLHHIGVENDEKISKLIKKLKLKSQFIIIKDHFQFGFFSNLLLIIMDLFSNYGDGTKIPKIYFNVNSYERLIFKNNFNEIKRINNKKYYKWYWFYFNKKNLQFLSILK